MWIWFVLDNCEKLCESSPCDDNAICTSTTTVTCTCKPGYVGTGTKGNCTVVTTTPVVTTTTSGVTTTVPCNASKLYK